MHNFYCILVVIFINFHCFTLLRCLSLIFFRSYHKPVNCEIYGIICIHANNIIPRHKAVMLVKYFFVQSLPFYLYFFILQALCITKFAYFYFHPHTERTKEHVASVMSGKIRFIFIGFIVALRELVFSDV